MRHALKFIFLNLFLYFILNNDDMETGFISAFDLYYDIILEDQIKNAYLAETALLSEILDDVIAEKIAEDRRAIQLALEEIYCEMCRMLPAVLSLKSKGTITPYGIELVEKKNGHSIVLSMISWIKDGWIYLQPAGMYEIEISEKIPADPEHYEIRIYFSNSAFTECSSSGCVGLEDLAETDRTLVEDFVKSVISYLNTRLEAEKKMTELEVEIKHIEDELKRIYDDHVFIYTEENGSLKRNMLIPRSIAENLSEYESQEDTTLKLNPYKISLALALLNAESFERAIVKDDWK